MHFLTNKLQEVDIDVDQETYWSRKCYNQREKMQPFLAALEKEDSKECRHLFLQMSDAMQEEALQHTVRSGSLPITTHIIDLVNFSTIQFCKLYNPPLQENQKACMSYLLEHVFSLPSSNSQHRLKNMIITSIEQEDYNTISLFLPYCTNQHLEQIVRSASTDMFPSLSIARPDYRMSFYTLKQLLQEGCGKEILMCIINHISPLSDLAQEEDIERLEMFQVKENIWSLLIYALRYEMEEFCLVFTKILCPIYTYCFPEEAFTLSVLPILIACKHATYEQFVYLYPYWSEESKLELRAQPSFIYSTFTRFSITHFLLERGYEGERTSRNILAAFYDANAELSFCIGCCLKDKPSVYLEETRPSRLIANRRYENIKSMIPGWYVEEREIVIKEDEEDERQNLLTQCKPTLYHETYKKLSIEHDWNDAVLFMICKELVKESKQWDLEDPFWIQYLLKAEKKYERLVYPTFTSYYKKTQHCKSLLVQEASGLTEDIITYILRPYL